MGGCIGRWSGIVYVHSRQSGAGGGRQEAMLGKQTSVPYFCWVVAAIVPLLMGWAVGCSRRQASPSHHRTERPQRDSESVESQPSVLADTGPSSRPAWLSEMGGQGWLERVQKFRRWVVRDWEAFLNSPSALDLAPDANRMVVFEARFNEKAIAVLNRYPQIDALKVYNSCLAADDFRNLAKVKHLKEIEFRLCRCEDDDLALLGASRSLISLVMRDCDGFSGTGLRPLVGLERLEIHGENLKDLTEGGLASLRHLSRLKSVEIWVRRSSKDKAFEPTNRILEYLKDHQDMRIIFLSGENISDEGLVNLAGMAGIERLGFDSSRITNAGLKHIAGLKALWGLGLINADIDGSGLAQLVSLADIKQLNVSCSSFDDASMGILARARSLRTLGLAETRVSDEGIRRILQLPNLEVINLSHTKVTDSGVLELGSLPNLQKLFLEGSGVTGSLPRTLPGNGAVIIDWLDIGVVTSD